MRPVFGLRPDRSSKAALLAFAAGLIAATPGPAWASARATDQIDGLIAAGAIALAVGASLWASALLGVAQRLRRQLQRTCASVRTAVAARDALVGAARDPVAVWGTGDGPAWSYGGAEAVVQSCLAGTNSAELAHALALLNQNGTPFRLSVSNETGDPVTLSGRPVGNMTAVWVETERGGPETDFRAVVDVLPIPVWVRDATRMLRWGNRAFLAAVARNDVNAAIGDQASVEKTERDLAAAALAEGHAVEARRFAVIGGKRR